jgi:hypothetical protein
MLLSLGLSACKPQPTPVYVPEGTDRDQLNAAALPFAQNILDSINKNDFSLFTKDFNAAMLQAMTKDQFAQIVKLYGGNGPVKSIELINIEVRGEFYGLNYKVSYNKTIVIMTVVLPKTEPRLVTGLWFK